MSVSILAAGDKAMRGPIYDYDNQRWTWIDTDTDRRFAGEGFRFQTPDGVVYELCPSDPKKYRNVEA